MKQQLVSTETKHKIAELYKSGINSLELGCKFNMSPSSVIYYLHKLNIEIRNPHDTALKYHFDEECFDEILTEEQGYWLGFIVADGCVTKNSNRIKIVLSSKDIKHLEKFKLFLKSSHPIKNFTKSNDFIKNGEYSEFSVFSPHTKKSLNKLGVHHNKTKEGAIPGISQKLQKHLLRGILDGDGWVSITGRKKCISLEAGICGNIFVIEWVSSKLKELKIIHKTTSDKSIFRIRLSNRRAEKFLDWLYQDSKIYLDRKYLKYQEYLFLTRNRYRKILPRGIRTDKRKKFYAFILKTEIKNSKEIFLGSFNTEQEAVSARERKLEEFGIDIYSK